MNSTAKRHLPLLIGFSVGRTGEDHLPGYYDEEQGVWVLDGRDGVKPIIEIAKNIAELESKTFVERERDDPDTMLYLESSTKTENRPERDDSAMPMMDLHLLFTNTEIQ